MTETQQLQNSTGSIPSPDKIQDTLRRMKVDEESNMEETSPYPDRPGERDCQFFLRTGLCGYGDTCRYNHPPAHLPQGVIYHRDELPERTGQPDCEYFLKTGACKYGATCKYHHPKDRNGAGPVLFNVLGYPMRQGEKSCPYYLHTGTCRFGVACKFHHPHPNHQPLNGHSTYPGGFPSVGYPYGGGLPMMSMPPATYGVMPHSQIPQPQAYMPYMVAPSLPPHAWTTYMGASNHIYNIKTQPDSSSSASVPVAVTSHQHYNFPDRGECRFFMNTGTCKYGDDCKYSHPKEMMLQPQPILLPSRPGQPACSLYKAYGFCKFGENCKFDHSMPLNSYYNTGFTMPTTAYAPPVSTHLKISSPPSSSDSTITVSNGKPAAEDQSSETEKQDDDKPAQPDNSEVQDSSDSTRLTNGKTETDAEISSAETKKQEDNLAKPDTAEVQDSDSTTLTNGKSDAEIKKQEDTPAKPKDSTESSS